MCSSFWLSKARTSIAQAINEEEAVDLVDSSSLVASFNKTLDSSIRTALGLEAEALSRVAEGDWTVAAKLSDQAQQRRTGDSNDDGDDDDPNSRTANAAEP